MQPLPVQTDIAIIGSGPIGLEAALRGKISGFNVVLLERGQVAENVASWGHVKLFSPFELNASSYGIEAIRKANSTWNAPKAEEYLTGQEFRERYLKPLSELPDLRSAIYEKTEVVMVGRTRYLKKDLPEKQKRAADSFQLLVRQGETEKRLRAKYVFDCSGTYGTHNWIGAGGIPALGEQNALSPADYLLSNIREKTTLYENRRTLVVGSGYSAATAIVELVRLKKNAPRTEIIWLTRSEQQPPIPLIKEDPLPERLRVSQLANAAVVDGEVTLLPGRLIEEVNKNKSNVYEIKTQQLKSMQVETVQIDEILALVGYHPDRSLYQELHLHECYATQGPIKLAASLLGETSADCLEQATPEAELLQNPEPNFYILGAKSYGRDSRFLIQIGLKQIQSVFEMMGL